MCRKEVKKTILVSSRIQLPEISLTNHTFFRIHNPVFNKFLKSLNEPWVQFIKFIHKTQYNDDFKGIKGTKILNLEHLEKAGNILLKEKSCIILQSEDLTQILFCCYLPNMTIRLVMSNEKIDFETDNAAADEAVECLNTQIEACWKVLPKLLHPTIYRLFIRKFENVVCSLALCGNNNEHDETPHCEPMKEQIGKLKECNFDSTFLQERKNKMPSLNLYKISIDCNVKSLRCCSPIKQ